MLGVGVHGVAIGRRRGAVVGPDTTVATAWAGAVTESTFKAAHSTAADTSGTRLVVSTDPTFVTGNLYSAPANTSSKTVQHTITGLAANTAYNFAIEVNGTVKTTKAGTFKTMAAAPGTAQSFRFGWGNCQSGFNNGSVLTTLRNLATKPRFFVHLGDMHYADIATNSEALFDSAIDSTLGGTHSGPFLRNVPTYWIQDDHDYGPNDSDSTSPSRTASLAVFRRRAPNPAGPLTGATDPTHYSFVQGRVRFLMTDGRSQRDANGVLGTTQVAWFKSEVDAAAAAGQFLVWCSGSTVAGNGLGSGSNSDYGVLGTHSMTTKMAERRDLYEYIRSKGLGRKTIILAGDAHAAQFDNGFAHDYALNGAAGGGAPIPNIHSGGIYTGGASVATGDYWSEGSVLHSASIQCMAGVVDVTDSGGASITLDFNVYGTDNTSTAESIVKTVSYTLPTTPPTLPTAAKQIAAAGFTTELGALNCTFATPATAGNQIILIVACRGTFPAGGYSTPGWTEFVTTTNDANITVRVYRRTAVGGETALGVSNTTGARNFSFVMLEIAANATTPVDATIIDAQQDNAAATGVTLSTTSTVDNCLAVAVHAQETGGTVGDRAWSNGFTEHWWDPLPGPRVSVAMKALGTAGAVSTALTIGEADERTGVLMCFRP